MSTFEYEIRQKIACLSEEKGGWTKEINLVSWGNNEAKYDIRAWSTDHTKMGKGITLSEEELVMLKSVLDELLSEHGK